MRTFILAHSQLVLIFAHDLNGNWLSQTHWLAHIHAPFKCIQCTISGTDDVADATLCKYQFECTCSKTWMKCASAFKYTNKMLNTTNIHKHHSKVFDSVYFFLSVFRCDTWMKWPIRFVHVWASTHLSPLIAFCATMSSLSSQIFERVCVPVRFWTPCMRCNQHTIRNRIYDFSNCVRVWVWVHFAISFNRK